MKIDEINAITLARKLAYTSGARIGDLCRVQHISKDEYLEKARARLDHGNWLVSFAYVGEPPTEADKGRIPPKDLPTTIVVNDETGAARFLSVL